MTVPNTRTWLAALALLVANSLGATSVEALFADAVEASARGNDEAALALYQQIAAQTRSAPLHYNMGNAHYRLGDFGSAILHYEKALAINPVHAEAQANLQRARKKAGVDAPSKPLLAGFAETLPVDLWSWLTVGGFWSAIGVFGLLPASRFWGTGAKITGALGAVVFLVGITALLTWYNSARGGIVVTPQAPLRTAPTSTAPVDAEVPAGTHAQVGPRYHGFTRITLPDGASGWMHDPHFKQIWEAEADHTAR